MKVTFEAITSVILGLVVVVLIYIWFISAQAGIRNIADSQVCQQSVELNAKLRYDRISGFTDIKCPTLFIEVPKSDQKTVFETTALALADTWHEFLEGRAEVFDTTTKNYCVVRRVLEFKEPMTYDGFMDYLLQHNPPEIKTPYFTYLTNIAVDEGIRSFHNNPNLKDTLDTSNKYAAVFVMTKKDTFWGIFPKGKVAGAFLGGTTGAIVGVIGSGLIIYAAKSVGLPLGATTSISLLSAGLSGGTLFGGATGFILGSSSDANWQATMLLIPYTEENIKSLDCTTLPVSLTGK